MKLPSHHYPTRRGSALVIVLVLLSVMGALVLGNLATLRRLKVELQLLEEKQKRAYDRTGPPGPSGRSEPGNAPPAVVP